MIVLHEMFFYSIANYGEKTQKAVYSVDENKKECNRAMDKIIELYKENEHGEELVKDIEKVYGMQHHSPRAKEFLKHALGMIKGN